MNQQKTKNDDEVKVLCCFVVLIYDNETEDAKKMGKLPEVFLVLVDSILFYSVSFASDDETGKSFTQAFHCMLHLL